MTTYNENNTDKVISKDGITWIITKEIFKDEKGNFYKKVLFSNYKFSGMAEYL